MQLLGCIINPVSNLALNYKCVYLPGPINYNTCELALLLYYSTYEVELMIRYYSIILHE